MNSRGKILLALCLAALLLCCCGSALAFASFYTENGYWYVSQADDEGLTVCIESTDKTPSHVQIPTHIERGENRYPVVRVILRKAVTEVAFELETDGGTPVREFYGPGIDCPITGLKVSEGVREVGGFSNCSHLTTVILPSTCTTIDFEAFAHCTSLTSINLDHVTSIGYRAFEDTRLPDALLPEGLVSLLGGAFKDCPTLERVYLPSTLVTLEAAVFQGCTSLTEVFFGPDFQIDSLAGNLFNGCASLAEITIPASVTALKASAFAECAALQSVHLPDGLLSIENYCFRGCDLLGEMTLPASLTAIEGEAALPAHLKKLVMADNIGFDYVPAFSAEELEELIAPVTVTKTRYNNAKFPSLKRAVVANTSILKGCQGTLEELTLLDPAYTSNSLQNYTALREVTLPNGMTAIPARMFQNCKQLYSVVLPEGLTENGSYLTEIGAYAFADCPMLGRLEIPDSVDTINGSAFQNDWIILVTRQGLAAWYTAKADPEDGIRVEFYDQIWYPNCVEPGLEVGADFITLMAPEVTPEGGNYTYAYFLESEDGAYRDAVCETNLTTATFTGLDTANVNYTCWVVVGYNGESIDMEARDVRADYNGMRSNNVPTQSAIHTPVLYLPSGLTSIEADAFQGIAAVSVVFPRSLSSIIGNPFAGSQVQYIYAYSSGWRYWAERNDYTFILLD